MIKEDIKFQDSTVFEGMTSIRAILKANESGHNNRKIQKILYAKERISKIAKEIGYLKAVSQKFGFEVIETTTEHIDSLTLGSSHGGIIAITGTRSITLLDKNSPLLPSSFYCMIQGIEDPYNFGYSLRSLYAAGCAGIILPKRNWMTAAGVVARSSAGASELFELYEAEAQDAAEIFKEKGYKIVCADERTDNILGKCELKLPLLLIVGGEKRGISGSLIEKADILVKINYAREFNASLSAASATTMFAYEIMRQNDIKI